MVNADVDAQDARGTVQLTVAGVAAAVRPTHGLAAAGTVVRLATQAQPELAHTARRTVRIGGARLWNR